ncbi:MAG: penicillin-binding protein 2 [Patescibacteria group bacterium]|nr:penicillin-binding protein 2 [Patescibacteria group bacterium]
MKLWKKVFSSAKTKNNRINLVMAIIFLFGFAIIFRLFNLQVMQHDYYLAIASDQQQIFNLLEPKRGKIFFQDSAKDSSNSFYPIATNKDFALIYTVPVYIKQANDVAEQFYSIFKEQFVIKEVEEFFKKEDQNRLTTELVVINNLTKEEKKIKEEEIKKNLTALFADKIFQELRQIKKEAEIKLRKEKIINDYLAILNKANDPYEPLEQKVDIEVLKKLYVGLAGFEKKIFNTQDLEIKNNKIFFTVIDKDNKQQKKELVISGIGFVMKPYRFYPENNIGANLLGFVRDINNEQRGSYGLEGFFDQDLYGKSGSLKAERDATGKIVIINDKEYNSPHDGSDIILTINRSIQFVVCEKLNQAILKHGADSGSVIIVNPKTGEILAMCSNPDFDPNNYQAVKNIRDYNNQAIFSQFEPGSIFKVITMAMGLDQKKIIPQTTYNDTGNVKIANYKIENSDHLAHGIVNMTEVLEQSLNTGAIFVMRQIKPDIFGKYIKDFGFGEKTGIELEGENKGDIKNLFQEKLNKELYAATASFGQGIAVTPLQITMAFAVLANNGILMKPYIVKEIIKPDGVKIITKPQQIRQVISEKAAMILGGMMVNVVENGHGEKAGVKGYYIAGKTGTAQVPKKDGRGYQEGSHIGSFAGFAPADNPQFVMLVKIDNPRDVEWAESSAAPLFGEIAEFILNYWQVPKER